MSELTLIYPHQLYQDQPAVSAGRKILLLEDALFFKDYQFQARFHKIKLVLHRASMKCYQKNQLADYESVYVEHRNLVQKSGLKRLLKKHQPQTIHVVDPTDYWLKKRIEEATEHLGISISWYPSPNFLTSLEQINSFFAERDRFFHHRFYQWQRRRLGVLIDNDEQPVGGQWSFDKDNRQPFNDEIEIPNLPKLESEQTAINEAKRYVAVNFSDHPGSLEWFGYPVTHGGAQRWWQDFLQQRFKQFGPFEDAIAKNENFLFHSVISPLLNIGLLDPKQVLNEALDYGEKNQTPLNSLEGFVRQLIGWREFMRAVYVLRGREQRASNFFSYDSTFEESWYQGETGLEPVDQAIKRLNKFAYTHHIERLMVLGNAMLLTGISPKQVYRWFMEMFVDAYDWVMVPNVYGMSQYADGGQIVTKPYISGSRYIRKMSNYENGEWCDIWDGLFWNFINEHQDKLRKVGRMALLIGNWQRQSSSKRSRHLSAAAEFIKQQTK